MKKNKYFFLKKKFTINLMIGIVAISSFNKIDANDENNNNFDGSFSVLTYNIAALPWPAYLSNEAGSPENRVPHIGARLHPFDIIGVQEQLSWIDTFKNKTHHPHYSTNKKLYSGGNGLDLFSKFPMTKTQRITYNKHPVYISKGFTKNTITIYPGVFIDIYNTHTGDPDKINPLMIEEQYDQLGQFIKENSPSGRAVIALGDYNGKPAAKMHGLRQRVMTKNNLLDAREVAFNVTDYLWGPVDRILYRSGDDVTITLDHYEELDRESRPGSQRYSNHFKKDGKRLSDHNPVLGIFKFKIKESSKKQSGDKIWLSELKVNHNNSVWHHTGPVGIDQAIDGPAEADGEKLHMNGVIYEKGLGVHANSHITFNTNKKYSRFYAEVGIDEEVGNNGKVRFQVYTDGSKVYDSGAMDPFSATGIVDIDLNDCNKIDLKVLDEGDGRADHADWANSYFILK